MPTISIVIPCFNNEAQLRTTCVAIAQNVAQFRGEGVEFELLLIDDCSTDTTWHVITALKNDFPLRIIGLRLGSNAGAYNAIVPGLERANGEAVIVMAADGDDPPQLIPEMVQHWQNGNQLVQVERDRPNGSWINRVFSQVFYFHLHLVGVKHLPENGCDFMLADHKLIRAALQRGFYSGNSLIQLYQHAEQAYSFRYRKGTNPISGWTWRKKVHLLIATLCTAVGLKRNKVVPQVVAII